MINWSINNNQLLDVMIEHQSLTGLWEGCEAVRESGSVCASCGLCSATNRLDEELQKKQAISIWPLTSDLSFKKKLLLLFVHLLVFFSFQNYEQESLKLICM